MRRTPPTEGPHRPSCQDRANRGWKVGLFLVRDVTSIRWKAAIALKVHGYKSQPISGLFIYVSQLPRT